MTGFQLEAVPGAGTALRATVDLGHEFYFDHPLAHLPGLLLLDVALVAIERKAADEDLRFTRFEAAFRTISALNLPLEAQVAALGGRGRYRCVLSQGGKVRAEVTAELSPSDAAGATDDQTGACRSRAAAPATPFVPLEQRLVRKLRPGNVLLGRRDDDILRPIRAPEDTAYGRSTRGRHGCYGPTYLTECFLQLCRASRNERPASGAGGSIPVSREILVLVGGQLLRPVDASEDLVIGFWPEPEPSRTPRHPHSIRRTAHVFCNSEVVARVFCDAVRL